MLLSFRVVSFRSIRDEQEFSMLRDVRRAGDGDRDPESAEESTWDPHVGTVAGIYGANASGKSNVLEALRFMRNAVLLSHNRWKPDGGVPVDTFLLDRKYTGIPSLFEVQIQLGTIRYQYGFRLTKEKVVSEWLYVYPGSRRQVWFERDIDSDEEYYFGKYFTGKNKTIAELTRPTSLFLSTAIANNHKQLSPIYHWFDHHLRIVAPSNRNERIDYTVSFFEKRPSRWKEISDMMHFADLGIADLRVRHTDLPDEFRKRLLRVFESISDDDSTSKAEDPDTEKLLEKVSRVVEVGHTSAAGESVYLPLTKESLGTQVWFALAGPILRVIANGDTLLVDELDASLHPRLTAEALRIFRDPTINPKQAQIIFTTHDTTLLGTLLDERELLRDQVWFTEKGVDGATTLYPLTDFAPRKAENLERGYLQGRYGAVPILDHRIILGIGTELMGSEAAKE